MTTYCDLIDTITAADVPATLDPCYVAGYIDGHPTWRSFTPLAARYPKATAFSVTVFGDLTANFADCETGDLTPAQAALWAYRKIQLGYRPTVYCNTSTKPLLVTALAGYGLQIGRDIDWWEARYDNNRGTVTPSPGAAGRQWDDHGPNGENYDRSVCIAPWPESSLSNHANPAPRGNTMPKPAGVGIAATLTGKGYWLLGADGGVFTDGDAAFYGSCPGQGIVINNAVGIVRTLTGHGYYIVDAKGGVYTFGDAQFYGSAGNLKLNAPVSGMQLSPSGKGYLLVAQDYGVFAFGDALFEGTVPT